MNQLVRFDTNTLNRALIGFDRLFNDVERRFANQVSATYPPHNIIKVGDYEYMIEMAVTGFAKEDITVEVDKSELIIKATHTEVDEDAQTEYIHRGLAARNIERRFGLTEEMEVGEAKVANGLLTVYIKVIVPDAPKPRKIEVKG